MAGKAAKDAKRVLLAILPENHSSARLEKVSVAALCVEPLMLLEKGAKWWLIGSLQRNQMYLHIFKMIE